MMSIAAMAAASLLATYPGKTPDTEARVQPYWDCVVHYAGQLESSGGSGEEVAIAAKQVCRERRMELQASIHADMLMNTQNASLRAVDQITAELETELRAEVILNVLAKRAKRHDDSAAAKKVAS